MDNATREALYLRDRADLTPAQARRHAKHARRSENRIARQGRIRRVYLSREARRLRREGANLVAAIRVGALRPRRIRLQRKDAA